MVIASATTTEVTYEEKKTEKKVKNGRGQLLGFIIFICVLINYLCFRL